MKKLCFLLTAVLFALPVFADDDEVPQVIAVDTDTGDRRINVILGPRASGPIELVEVNGTWYAITFGTFDSETYFPFPSTFSVGYDQPGCVGTLFVATRPVNTALGLALEQAQFQVGSSDLLIAGGPLSPVFFRSFIDPDGNCISFDFPFPQDAAPAQDLGVDHQGEILLTIVVDDDD